MLVFITCHSCCIVDCNSKTALITTVIPLSLRTSPFAVRRKGLGMCPHSSCPYGMQLCIVISDLWRHRAHVHCRSARCSPQLSSNTRVKHRTAQRFAVSSVDGTESLKKNHFHDVICNQRFWLVRSTFRPGDNSDVCECPDPSSSLQRVWFRD